VKEQSARARELGNEKCAFGNDEKTKKKRKNSEEMLSDWRVHPEKGKEKG